MANGAVGPTFMLPSPDRDHIVSNITEEANLAKQNEIINEEIAGLHNEISGGTEIKKKVFVEPTISVPVDVLEATTFFQTASSGTTN